MIDDFDKRVNPAAGYNVIEGANDVIPLEMLPTDNQKIVIFDDMVCEKKPKRHYRLFYERAAAQLQRHLSFSKLLQDPQKHP